MKADEDSWELMESCESLRHCKYPLSYFGIWRPLFSANIGPSSRPVHLHWADSEVSILPQRMGLAPTYTAPGATQELPPMKSAQGHHDGFLDLASHLVTILCSQNFQGVGLNTLLLHDETECPAKCGLSATNYQPQQGFQSCRQTCVYTFLMSLLRTLFALSSSVSTELS